MKENQNSGAKIGMVVFLIISVLLAGYIIYNKTLNKGTTVVENNQQKLLTTMVSNDKNPSIKSLTITNVRINDATSNNRLTITGSIDLSIDDSLFDGVSLEGYCLDTNNKSYSIYGPQDGRALFHNGSAELSLSEDLQTVHGADWNNITIKYCKVNKMTAYISTKDYTNLAKLTITKDIDINYEKNF